MTVFGRVIGSLRGILERRLLGVSAEEIRYTISDVRAEIRATRSELLAEIAELRADVERIAERSRSPIESRDDHAPGERGPELPQ